MAEEFEESEVIFHEKEKPTHYVHKIQAAQTEVIGKEKLGRKKEKRNSISVPMNIPEDVSIRCVEAEFIDDDYDDGGEMVPPHEIVGRRIPTKMAFSVCSGNGRTLKGRDLSEVRNSILRMTGFLET